MSIKRHNPGPVLSRAVEYGGLCFLLIRAIRGSEFRMARDKVVIAAVIFASLYGASDEIHQIFVPGRTPSFLDLFFDFMGALAVGLLKR